MCSLTIIFITRTLIWYHLKSYMGCRSLISLFEAGGVEPLGVNLVNDAQDKMRSIQAKLLATQSRQKKYVDHKVRNIASHTREIFFLRYHP